MWPPGAEVYEVRVRAESSWVSPSLAGARVADAGRALGRAGQGHVGRHRVVPVGRVGDGAGAEDHRDARGVHHAGVGAGILGPAAAVAVDVGVEPGVQVQAGQADPGPGQPLQVSVHQHGVPGRVGDVGRDQPVAVLDVGGGHRAGHAGGVGGHRVGHVPRLQVGERGPVGHDVLQRAHVGVVDGGLVDVGEHPARHGVPGLGGRPGRRAQAVLPGQVEIGGRAGRAGRRRGHRGGAGGRGGDSQSRQQGDAGGERDETASAYHERTPPRDLPEPPAGAVRTSSDIHEH